MFTSHSWTQLNTSFTEVPHPWPRSVGHELHDIKRSPESVFSRIELYSIHVWCEKYKDWNLTRLWPIVLCLKKGQAPLQPLPILIRCHTATSRGMISRHSAAKPQRKSSRGQSSGFWRYNSHRFLPFHELTQILLWFHDVPWHKRGWKKKKGSDWAGTKCSPSALQVLSRRLAGEMCSRLGASPSSCTRIKAWHPPVSDSTLGGPPYEVRDTCSDQVNKKTMVLLRDDLRLIYPISHWERKVKNIGTISITNVNQTWTQQLL